MKSRILLSALTLMLVTLTGCSSTGGTDAVSAKALFDRFVEVTSKGKGMDAHKAFTMKGQLLIPDFGIEAHVTIRQMAPNYLVIETEIMGAALTQGCNADACWNQQPGQGISVMSGSELDTFRRFADFTVWENIDRYYPTLEIVEETTANTDASYKVRAVTADGTEDFYFFSKETGLMTGTIITADSAMGRITTTAEFSNYQEFGGMLFATEQLQSTPMATINVVIDSVTFAPLSAADFTMPN